jgi:hypothetical protein
MSLLVCTKIDIAMVLDGDQLVPYGVLCLSWPEVAHGDLLEMQQRLRNP